MPTTDLIERQREELRALRRSADERAAADAAEEARFAREREGATIARRRAHTTAEKTRGSVATSAEAGAKRERGAADAELATAIKAADQHLRVVKSALATEASSPQYELQQVGLANLMRASVSPAALDEQSDLLPQIGWHVAMIEAASHQIRGAVLALARLQVERNRRAQRWRRMIVVATLLLLLASGFGVPLALAEHQYQEASQALAAGQWARARDLTPITLLGVYHYYKNSENLHDRALTQAAQAALDAGNVEEARAYLLQTKTGIRSDLFNETYYRTAVIAMDAKDWTRAENELTHVIGGSGYKDAGQRYLMAITRGGQATTTLRYDITVSNSSVGVALVLTAIDLRPIGADVYEMRLTIRIMPSGPGTRIPFAQSATLTMSAQTIPASDATGIFRDAQGGAFTPVPGVFGAFAIHTGGDEGAIIFNVRAAKGVSDCFNFNYGAFFVLPVCFSSGKHTAASLDGQADVAVNVPDEAIRIVARRWEPDGMEA